MTDVHIRAMTPADLDFAAWCTEVVGWGAQRGEFEGFQAYDPQSCLVAEAPGQRIGVCVATPYGEQGFLGMLIVVPEARGRGVGRCLIEHALAYLHGRGVRSVSLDGVTAAVPLYERAGFRKQCRSLRFSGTLRRTAPFVRRTGVRSMTEADLDAVCALDRLAFGADRSFFLARRLAQGPDLCKVLEQGGQIAGYVFGRGTRDSVTAGPWVVRPTVARPADLLEALAPEGGETRIGLGILESNRAAVQAARALGLQERADPPWRMRRVLADTCVLADARADDELSGPGTSPLAYAVGSPAKG